MGQLAQSIFGNPLISFAAWILNFIVIATRGLALLAGTILDWATGPNFVKWGYTQNNPVVEIGLGITKQFVNLGLVVALIVIAFAITLRIKDYGAKKTLAKLIIVALLVNFAPILVGLIIDASNIVMNYFLMGVRDGISGIVNDISQKQTDSLINRIYEGRVSLGTQISVIVMIIVHVILNISIAFAFILLASIFIFRYIIIWLLTILSPLAFVSLILPATKKFWNKWWEQLIQWSIIGIPMAFFLYLAMASFSKLSYDFTQQLITPGLGKEVSEGFAMVLPYILTLVLLYLGFIMGLTTSAMGATSIINFTKTKSRATAGWAGRQGWQATKWTGRKTLQGAQLARENIAKTEAGKKAQAWGQRQLARKPYGEGVAGFWGTAARTGSKLNIGRYITRGVARTAGGNLPSVLREDIENAENSVKDIEETPVLLKKFHDAITDTKRIGILNKIIEKDKIKDATNKEKFGESAIGTSEVDRLMKHAKNWEADKTIKKAFPDIAAKYVTTIELNEAKTKDSRVNSRMKVIVSGMKRKDYENIPEQTVKNKDFINAFIEFGDGKGLENMIEKNGKIVCDEIEKLLKFRAGKASEMSGKKITAEQYLEDVNKGLHKYLTKGPASNYINLK